MNDGLTGFNAGDEIGIILERANGETEALGPWTVPHDLDKSGLSRVGEEIGERLLFELAAQKPVPVVSARVVTWEDAEADSNRGGVPREVRA